MKDGYFDGCYSYYVKGKPDYKAWYKNGLQNGNEIHYYNGKIRTSTMYEKGFLQGSDILYDYNGVDTALVIDYHANENKMDVYLDEYFLESYKIIYIGLLQNTCFLKAQEYQQSFYSRKDSSLLHRNIWIKEEDGEYELKY